MIHIKQSKTADTRTCDSSKVSKETLHDSSIQHIGDIHKAMNFFTYCMKKAAAMNLFTYCMKKAALDHDYDKLRNINEFHADFITGFKNTTWRDNHRKISRHHLLQADGVPADVNLIDVLEMIADCVMAGMGRAGTVYPLTIDADVLKRAVDNTVELLKNEIVVDKDE